MAKKKQPKKGSNATNTSSTLTSLTPKGMIKDTDAAYLGDKNWSHAINAVNNSVDGDTGVVGNEPGNILCTEVPYTIIGTIHLYGDQWVLFLSDGNNHEIGKFDDSKCEYTTLVNDACLNFNPDNLIIGASKENFDCTWQVYWDDGFNPSRTLNIDHIPWNRNIISPVGSDCVIYEDTDTLNCELLRLAPLMTIPCLELSKAPEGGSLRNGSYQMFFAYTVNEQVIGDYIGISNIQPIWSHEDTQGSLDIKVTNVSKDFEFYRIVVVLKHQGGQIAKLLGTYSTEQSDINIDFINPSLIDVDIKDLPRRNPAYEKSSGMFAVNDYLIRTQPVEQFDFNYQPLANQIGTQWVSAEYPAEYYTNGGSKPTFVRDEQYAFFIRFIYTTGERSSSYHIPGRPPELVSVPGQTNVDETADTLAGSINNISTTSVESIYETYNTASQTGTFSIPTNDGGTIIAKGSMGYWQSTERYPATNPERWNATHHTWSDPGNTLHDLCGKNIRHHKFPDEMTSSTNGATALSTPDGQKINILGVEFNNIAPPLDNNGDVITNIQSYEILTGGREGNKSIIAKGIIRNMMEYTSIEGDGNEGSGVTHLMPNYPYNDTGDDPYLIQPGGGAGFPSWITNDHWLKGCDPLEGTPLNIYRTKHFSFHSPETQFENIYLNPYEIKQYASLNGKSIGSFKKSEGHPQHKLLKNLSATIAVVVGFGYAVQQIRGKRNMSLTAAKSYSIGQDGTGDAHAGNSTNMNITAGTATASAVPPVAVTTSPIITETTTARSGGAWRMSAPNSLNTYSSTQAGFQTGTFGTQAGLSDTYLTGFAFLGGYGGTEEININTWTGVEKLVAANMPGHIGPDNTVVYEGTKYKSIPFPMDTLTGALNFAQAITEGGQEIIDLIYNLMSTKDYVFKYNSHGFYSATQPFNTTSQHRQIVERAIYVKGGLQNFSANVKINNLHRPKTVVIETAGVAPLAGKQGSDNSKFIIGDEITNSSGDKCDWYSPETRVTRNISANYVALKVENDNQYGQLHNIKQFPVRGCVYNFSDQQLMDAHDNLIPIVPSDRFTTSALFGGDNYINRYTEKVIMPFWWNFMQGEPNMTPFDYRLYTNVPIPRFWMNTAMYQLDEMIKPIMNFTFTFGSALPSGYYNLDLPPSEKPSFLPSIGSGSGGVFTMDKAYMYTHNNGIQDFFVESELNMAFRDYGEDIDKKHYDKHEFTDLKDLFHADHITKGNFYKYDKGLSKKYFQLGISASFGELQEPWYDATIAETCWTEYPKRLIYSLQAHKESKKDFWRVFLPLNFKDFKDRVTTIKPINEAGALMLFPKASPKLFMGVDVIKSSSTKYTIGDGGLFSREPQNVTNSDVSHEYGSCESARSVAATPAGVFFVSQAQGKIFNYAGKGAQAISDQGMKGWFNKHLPSKLLQQYPELENHPLGDNPLTGIGCQAVYDPNDDLVYFSKRDYRVKDEWLDFIHLTNVSTVAGDHNFYYFDGDDDFPVSLDDTTYFEDASWTVSYDPKSKAWISFHDWYPELSMNSINHFMTTKTIGTATTECPEGMTYNTETEMCCGDITVIRDAIVSVSQIPGSAYPDCNCPADHTLVPGSCVSGSDPICKKVECECKGGFPSSATLTTLGDCPLPTTTDWLAVSNGQWNGVTPIECTWEYESCIQPLVTVGSIWKHNVRTDLYSNFYGVDYPWEVDLLQSSGQVVNTVRNIEYQMEAYIYKNDSMDRFHDLDFNFDEAEIYNSEQTSGLLKLNISPKNNAPLLTQYPIISSNHVDILYSKEEQKYRFNQFWDVTSDRGEFTGIQEPIYITRLNGYIRDLNMSNINMFKDVFQRKKFRHYYNHVVLRRSVSNDRKMLLRLNNAKINVSQR